LVPYDVVVPHSNHAFVAEPFGFTDPFNVAVVANIEVAGLVVTVGPLIVVKVKSEPLAVPAVLLASSLK
jgi:hypothetical protein